MTLFCGDTYHWIFPGGFEKTMILPRIPGQIEKLRGAVAVVHIFVLLPADHEHTRGDAVGMVFAEGKVLVFFPLSGFYERPKALSVQALGSGQS